MKTRLQICANGNECNIRELHLSLNMIGKVRVLKPTILTPQYAVETWEWCSPYQECLTSFPENEISDLLSTQMIAILKSLRENLNDLMIVIVCQYGTNEVPNGYSISSDLIKTLADIGASLEIDITPNLSQ